MVDTLNRIDADAVKGLKLLGFNQQYVSYPSASRTLGVTYTNNTDKPIFISICLYLASQWGVELFVDNIIVSKGGSSIGGPVNGNLRCALQAVIPVGSSYRAAVMAGYGTPTIEAWVELRDV